MSAEFERLVAQFERFQSKVKHIDDQFAGIGQMQEEVSALEASASSPGRSVTVVAGPGGFIKDIKLS
ncbi:MAG: YbaB/EbfC family nucleoid-associated protein, partial [Pseudonocardiaceae bacterium]